MSPDSGSGLYERIYSLVKRVPAGRVTTYGQIAALAGGCTPRIVGYAMAAVKPEARVPWHRVINSKGEVSARGGGETVQRRMLEHEGVEFDERGRVDLSEFLWDGPKLRRRRKP